MAGHSTYHVNMIKLKWEIIWTRGLPHLPGVPHLRVNRPQVVISIKVGRSFLWLKISEKPPLNFVQWNITNVYTFHIHSFIFISHITHHYNKGELQRKLKEADGEETCRKETTGLIKNQVSSDWKKASLIWQYEPAKSCIGGRFSYLSIQRVVKLWKENEKPPGIGSA